MTADEGAQLLHEVHGPSPAGKVFDEHVEVVLQRGQQLVGDDGSLRHLVRERV